MTKSDVILHSIIQEYLKSGEAIGSSELKQRGGITLAASSIRIYFKKLDDLGYVTQRHSSGGRIPTKIALKQFWNRSISDKILHLSTLDAIQEASSSFELFVRMDEKEDVVLEKIYNIEDKFLLLDFGGDEISIRYSHRQALFLQDFIGVSKEALIKLVSSVGLYSLARKIVVSFQEKIVFQQGYELLQHRDFFANDFVNNYFFGHAFSLLENGIYFEEIVPEGYMLVKRDGVYEGKDVSFTVIGKINSNFVQFFKEIDTRKGS